LPSRPGHRGQPRVARAPLSASTGHFGPGTKSSCMFVFNSRNFRNCSKLVKFIFYSLFIRKICIICQNVQENELYLFMSNSCIVNQHLTLPKVE
jgi:hypothetical protein